MMNAQDKALYDQFAAKHGSVEFKGRSYALIDRAELTNRLFEGWWGDAYDGDEYVAEWSAPAMGEDGYEYAVLWQFDVVKGEEPEDDTLPWQIVHNVIAI